MQIHTKLLFDCMSTFVPTRWSHTGWESQQWLGIVTPLTSLLVNHSQRRNKEISRSNLSLALALASSLTQDYFSLHQKRGSPTTFLNLEKNHEEYIYQLPDSRLHSHTFHQPTASWGGLSATEKNNSIQRTKRKDLGRSPFILQVPKQTFP